MALEYNPFAYEIHEDPYPMYARLREEAPVYHHPTLDFYAYSRHADVLAAIRDTETYTNTYGVSVEPSASTAAAQFAMSFLGLDPPRHTKMRALVSRGFTPRRVAELEPRIRALAVGYLERMRESRRSEFIADLAGVLPIDVISELLGVPAPDRAELRKQADLLVHREEGVFDVPPAARVAFGEIWSYFGERIAERRRAPQERPDQRAARGRDRRRAADADRDPVLLQPDDRGRQRDHDEAARERAVLAVAQPRPAQARERGSALIPRWIEETLRYDNSSQAIGRFTNRAVTLHGCEVPAGKRVLLLLGSANRDERAFPHADAYDLRRDTTASLSFGQGAHFCLGASLARLEGRVVLDEFWRRFADYQVEPAGSTRVHSVSVRGFATLPLELRGG